MIRFIYRLYHKYTEKRFIIKKVFHIEKLKRITKFIKKARFISRIRRRRVNLRNFEPIRKKNWRINLRRILYTIKNFNKTKQNIINVLHNKNYSDLTLWTGLSVTQDTGEVGISVTVVFAMSALIIVGCLLLKKKMYSDITETTENSSAGTKTNYDSVMDFWELYKKQKNPVPQDELITENPVPQDESTSSVETYEKFQLAVNSFEDDKYKILKTICENKTGRHPTEDTELLSKIKSYLLEHLTEINAAGYGDKLTEIQGIIDNSILHIRLKGYYLGEAKNITNSISVWPTEEYITLNTLVNYDNSSDLNSNNLDTAAQLKTLLARFKEQIISGNYDEADIAKFRYVRSVLKINSKIEYSDEMLKDLLSSNDLENQFEVLYYLAQINRTLTQEQQSDFETWFNSYAEEIKNEINHVDPSLITSMLNVILEYISNS